MNTKELLSGFGGSNITVRALAQYTTNSGVFVSLHANRYRGNISLPPQLIMKIDKLSPEAKKAYSNYVSLGSLCFIPKEYEDEIVSVEGAARYRLKVAAVNDGFVPMARYITYKAEFEELREQYFQARDHVLAHWDEICSDFVGGVCEMVAAAKVLKREQPALVNSILNQIPSKEAYATSFDMKLDVRAFPGQPDTAEMHAVVAQDVTDGWKHSVVENAIGCITTLVQDVFTACSNASAKYVDKGVIGKNSINGVVALSSKIKGGNLFRNPLLEEAGNRLLKLQNIDDPDEQEVIVEDVLGSLYQYSCENGIDVKISPKGLTKKALDDMLAIRKAKQQPAC